MQFGVRTFNSEYKKYKNIPSDRRIFESLQVERILLYPAIRLIKEISYILEKSILKMIFRNQTVSKKE
jgi:hypothetical protein